MVQQATLQTASASPPKRRTVRGRIGEFFLWFLGAPVVAILVAVIATMLGVPTVALIVVFAIVGIVALSMALKPSDRLPLGRGRAMGLIWAALAGVSGANSPPINKETQMEAAPAAAPASIVAVSTTSPDTESAPSVTASAAPEPVTPAAGPLAPMAPPSKWTYSSSTDDMRGTTTRFANIESDNQLNFGFPYGRHTPRLSVRERPTDGLNIIVVVDGQFICSSYSDDTVAVKFDDGPITNYRCTTASDGSANTLFIQDEKGFLAKLQRAKTVIIEAEFFKQGNQQMTFSTGGLNW